MAVTCLSSNVSTFITASTHQISASSLTSSKFTSLQIRRFAHPTTADGPDRLKGLYGHDQTQYVVSLRTSARDLSWNNDDRKTRLVATSASFSSVSSTSASPENGDKPPPGCSRISVEIGRPLGLVLEEDVNGNIFVAEVAKEGNAEKLGVIDVGDQLIATSAVVYEDSDSYGGVLVRKGMRIVRLNVRGETFDTVLGAIGTHPAHMKVTLELQKCKPLSSC